MKPENKNPVYKSWAVLTVFGIFNAALFYYAGIKSKSKKYIKVGHFYLFLAFLSLFINMNIPFITNAILCLYSAGYIFGIFFAIGTVPEYRKRLAMLKLLDHDTLNSKKIYSVNNQNLAD